MEEAGRSAETNGALRRRIARFLSMRPRLVQFAVFALVSAVTVLSTIAIELNERENEKALMREVSHSVASELDRRLSGNVAFLRAGAALFTILDTVGRADFTSFVSELPRKNDQTASPGIGWAEVVSPDQVPAYEQRISAELGLPVKIASLSPADQARLVPVTYLEPATNGNQALIGFDLYSDPDRRKALDWAAQNGKPASSEILERTARPAQEAAGFLIIMPVYDRANAGKRLKGYVFSPFDASNALEAAMTASAHPELHVHLYDGDPVPGNLLASHQGSSKTGVREFEEIEIANHMLTVEVEASRDFSLSLLALETLIFGLAVAVLLTLLVRLFAQQAIADQKSVEKLKEQDSIRATLGRELNHRAKNTLANVLSIISLTRRRSEDLDGFANSLEARVRALSATHDLLTRSEWSATSLRDVLTTELEPLAGIQDGVIDMSGPDVLLAPNDALSLGLAVHELATNAAKYGALSAGGGKVSINWKMQADELVVVDWHEEGGPPVRSNPKRGFGTELIEKIVAHELKHPVDLRFEPGGVRCIFHVPVRTRGEFEIRQRPSIRQL